MKLLKTGLNAKSILPNLKSLKLSLLSKLSIITLFNTKTTLLDHEFIFVSLGISFITYSYKTACHYLHFLTSAAPPIDLALKVVIEYFVSHFEGILILICIVYIIIIYKYVCSK